MPTSQETKTGSTLKAPPAHSIFYFNKSILTLTNLFAQVFK